MSFLRDAENMAQDFGGNNQQGGNQMMNDAEQAMGNQGGNQGGSGGMMRDAEQAMGNQGGNQGGSGGGFMSNLENQGKDQMMNQEVNSFLTKEGVPQGADSTIDKYADQEANKFM